MTSAAGTRGRHVEVDEVAQGVTRIRAWTRTTMMNGMEVSCYVAGGVLVDTGFSHVGDPVAARLAGRDVGAIVLTHHHEDHSGNAAAIAREHGCRVHVRNAGARETEGVVRLRFYRRLYWGRVEPYDAVEAGEAPVEAGGRTLWPVPIPGHSATHTAWHDRKAGIVFTGDLYVSGGATQVMSHENPYESIASLRRVADLGPSLMLTGHGIAMRDPAGRLGAKADRIEEAAARVVDLHGKGWGERRIVNAVFGAGKAKDLVLRAFTGGEFSRANFVRACVRHAAGRDGA